MKTTEKHTNQIKSVEKEKAIRKIKTYINQ